ncbi:WD40 repeat-like protein [Ascodesmis nigricans]|uniref:WD40 repeat-like protein n=1 Tax=Ascodesmis nigricans TaxID=341454 RepID=A0A4S2N496_9PEZI|nr:WD40 repeat-like protein [Ascodesmis nigricans]
MVNHPAPEDLLDVNEAEEIIEDDGDHPMDEPSDDEDNDGDQEVQLENDASGYFDSHTDSIFTIATHPQEPTLHITGGGDDVGYIFRSIPKQGDDGQVHPFACTQIQQLPKHADSITAAAFTASGAYAITAGLDGAVHVFKAPVGNANGQWQQTARIQEVEEIVWMAPAPLGDAFALGALDGSVWIYDIEASGTPVIRHVFNIFSVSCTAGAWSKDGTLLAATSEDGGLHVWHTGTGEVIVTLDTSDARFVVESGLFSVGISPSGAALVIGGGEGELRVIALRGDARGKLIASLKPHTESVESIAFHPSVPVVATASVDGTIAILDPTKAWAVRGTLSGHQEAVVKVEWVPDCGQEWLLTSCGVDGTVRRWDARLGTELGVWRGHLGGNQDEGEGGVLGFVQTRDRVVTAGDDHVALVFDVSKALGVAGAGPSVGIPR